jgi:hypothetical protein
MSSQHDAVDQTSLGSRINLVQVCHEQPKLLRLIAIFGASLSVEIDIYYTDEDKIKACPAYRLVLVV